VFGKNFFGKKLGANVFSSIDSSLLQFKQNRETKDNEPKRG
jgi:hypothetical protein